MEQRWDLKKAGWHAYREFSKTSQCIHVLPGDADRSLQIQTQVARGRNQEDK